MTSRQELCQQFLNEIREKYEGCCYRVLSNYVVHLFHHGRTKVFKINSQGTAYEQVEDSETPFNKSVTLERNTCNAEKEPK